jgi:hypothetical protein
MSANMNKYFDTQAEALAWVTREVELGGILGKGIYSSSVALVRVRQSLPPVGEPIADEILLTEWVLDGAGKPIPPTGQGVCWRGSIGEWSVAAMQQLKRAG